MYRATAMTNIMVSSTVRGIEPLLDQVYAQLGGYGYTVWMSHKGTIPVHPGLNNDQNSVRAARECDCFLGIITGRWGSGIFANEVRAAVAEGLESADVLIMAAAPADYRPCMENDRKLPKTDGALSLTLEPTVDVLMDTIDRRRPGAVVVGFALESDDGLERARAKLERKQLDMIVLNMAREAGSGFESLSNRVTIISKDEVQELPLMSKMEVAERLLDRVESLL